MPKESGDFNDLQQEEIRLDPTTTSKLLRRTHEKAEELRWSLERVYQMLRFGPSVQGTPPDEELPLALRDVKQFSHELDVLLYLVGDRFGAVSIMGLLDVGAETNSPQENGI